MSEAMAATAHFDFLSRRLLGEARIAARRVVLHCRHVFASRAVAVLAAVVVPVVGDDARRLEGKAGRGQGQGRDQDAFSPETVELAHG